MRPRSQSKTQKCQCNHFDNLHCLSTAGYTRCNVSAGQHVAVAGANLRFSPRSSLGRPKSRADRVASHPYPSRLWPEIGRASRGRRGSTSIHCAEDAVGRDGQRPHRAPGYVYPPHSYHLLSLTIVAVTPLDVVRVRLQSQSHVPSAAASKASTLSTSAFANLPPNLGISSCCREVFWVNNNAPYCVVGAPSMSVISNTGVTSASCAAEEAQSRTFTSTLDGIRKIARYEGPRTLWRGLSPTLLMAVPGNVIYFAGYDWLRFAPESPFLRLGMNDNYAPLFAGSAARVLAAIAVSPIEMFRTRMQASNSMTSAGHFRDTMQGMREMIQTNGLRSMWTGLSLTLWRDVPFSAIYWWGYEYCRNELTNMREKARGRGRIDGRRPDAVRLRSQSRSREDHTATLIDSFVAGATSGAVAAFVTTPFDVGKTRQQVVKHAKDTVSTSAGQVGKLPEELVMPRFLWHIFKEQGMSGLFKGWGARCLKVAPACAIMISSYELGKKMAGGINEKRDQRRNPDR
jgi:solute carrier family 25 protein 39/40